jgi:hypothetical protein
MLILVVESLCSAECASEFELKQLLKDAPSVRASLLGRRVDTCLQGAT